MNRFLTTILGCTALAGGCKEAKKQPPSLATDTVSSGSGSDKGMIVQPRFSGGEEAPSDEGRIPFTITKVDTDQKPTTTAPFHAAGGTWTYIEAHLDGDPAASFVVGLPTFASSKGAPGFGKVMFVPTTSAAGARVVEGLGKVLGTTVPPPRAGGVPQAVKVPVAVLGHGIGRLDNGLGGSGTWDATKLFCSVGDIDSAELFFNVSVADKKGEFSEKDRDYNKDVVACLATILRDGLPPPRSLANDPTLVPYGPRLEIGTRIGGRRMSRLASTPARMLMLDERGDSAALVEVDVKTGATKDLYTTPERLEGGACDATLTHCVLKQSVPKEDRNTYGDDPSHLVWLEGTTVTPLAIGTSQKASLGSAALSPDGRFVVAHDYTSRPAKLVALDRTTKKLFELAGMERGSLDVVGWYGTTAIVEKNTWKEGESPTVLEWQLGGKGATKPSTRPAEAPLTSPDGKRRAEFASGKLTLTGGAGSRVLVLHPDDARVTGEGCCTWIDNRYLAIPGGFIDTDALKVSLLPAPEGDDPPRIEYIAGSHIAIVSRQDGAYLATIVTDR